ncbi:MAG: DMT family transporter [Rhizobiaceae bacterium]|nr:DMT family transporter [Rhizobiaceae bacterium]
MTRGLLYALASFALYAAGDAFIKAAGASTPVFVIAFFVTLFSLVAVVFARPADERWLEFWRMNNPRLTVLRGFAGVGAGMCGFYAFSRLPLAEAYTLIFLMPFFVTVLSIIFLKEQVGWRRWTALTIGMIGVLIVIRPGFRELQLAHLAALAAGFCGATAMVIVRQIGATEKRTSLFGMSLGLAMLVNGALMAPGFVLPALPVLAMLAAAGLLHGVATLLILFASQRVPANRIAPVQYSQLIWGVLLGLVFFGERPDGIALIGLVLVAVSGLLTFIREDRRGVWPLNFRDIRNRF